MDGTRQLSNCVSTHEHLPCRLCGYDEQPSTEQPASAAGSKTTFTVGDYACDNCGWHSSDTSRPLGRGVSVGCPNCQYEARYVGSHEVPHEPPAPAAQRDESWGNAIADAMERLATPAAQETGEWREWEVECQRVLVAEPQRLRVVIKEVGGIHRVIVAEDSPARFEQALIDFEHIVRDHNEQPRTERNYRDVVAANKFLLKSNEEAEQRIVSLIAERNALSATVEHNQEGVKFLGQCLDDAGEKLARLVGERDELREALKRLGGYAAALEMTVSAKQEGEPLKEAWALLNEQGKESG